MAKSEITIYHCDKCGKNLGSCHNDLLIVTALKQSSIAQFWSRLQVKIFYSHGMHNDAKTETADLCQACAIDLLSDALKRVRAGERTTAGAVHAEQEGWE